MYSVGGVDLISLGLGIWLLALSYFFWKEKNYLRQLFPKSDQRDIRNKFKEVLEAIEVFTKSEQIVNKHLGEIERESLGYVQKLAILRYNPYNDTGGDQSFSVVILNGKLDGFLLTSLHSRSGTRVYTKVVKGGKSEVELSKEEAEVLQKGINS